MADDKLTSRHHLITFSLQYYVAGRWAATSRLHRVAPILLHHAVELILKSALIPPSSLEQLKEDHNHQLASLWQAAVLAIPSVKTPTREQTIIDLDKFEGLRYPDSFVSHGATITVGFLAGENPVVSGTYPSSGPVYRFNLEDIDELWSGVFLQVANPEAFVQHLSQEAREALTIDNQHPVWVPLS
jgi:hypothetical protein